MSFGMEDVARTLEWGFLEDEFYDLQKIHRCLDKDDTKPLCRSRNILVCAEKDLVIIFDKHKGCIDGTYTHPGVCKAYVSQDDSIVVSMSKDGKITTFDGINKAILNRLDYGKIILDVFISPNSQFVAVLFCDNKMSVYNIKNMRQRKALNHVGSVEYLAFSKDSRFLVTCSKYQTRMGGINIPKQDIKVIDLQQSFQVCCKKSLHTDKEIGMTFDSHFLFIKENKGQRSLGWALIAYDLEKQEQEPVLCENFDDEPISIILKENRYMLVSVKDKQYDLLLKQEVEGPQQVFVFDVKHRKQILDTSFLGAVKDFYVLPDNKIVLFALNDDISSADEFFNNTRRHLVEPMSLTRSNGNLFDYQETWENESFFEQDKFISYALGVFDGNKLLTVNKVYYELARAPRLWGGMLFVLLKNNQVMLFDNKQGALLFNFVFNFDQKEISKVHLSLDKNNFAFLLRDRTIKVYNKTEYVAKAKLNLKKASNLKYFLMSDSGYLIVQEKENYCIFNSSGKKICTIPVVAVGKFLKFDVLYGDLLVEFRYGNLETKKFYISYKKGIESCDTSCLTLPYKDRFKMFYFKDGYVRVFDSNSGKKIFSCKLKEKPFNFFLDHQDRYIAFYLKKTNRLGVFDLEFSKWILQLEAFSEVRAIASDNTNTYMAIYMQKGFVYVRSFKEQRNVLKFFSPHCPRDMIFHISKNQLEIRFDHGHKRFFDLQTKIEVFKDRKKRRRDGLLGGASVSQYFNRRTEESCGMKKQDRRVDNLVCRQVGGEQSSIKSTREGKRGASQYPCDPRVGSKRKRLGKIQKRSKKRKFRL